MASPTCIRPMECVNGEILTSRSRCASCAEKSYLESCKAEATRPESTSPNRIRSFGRLPRARNSLRSGVSSPQVDAMIPPAERRTTRSDDPETQDRVERIRELPATMRVPLEHVDLDDSKHLGILIRELPVLNRGHTHLTEIRALLKRRHFYHVVIACIRLAAAPARACSHPFPAPQTRLRVVGSTRTARQVAAWPYSNSK